MSPKHGILPPPPTFTRRELSPAARRSISGVRALDADTPSRAHKTHDLGALISVFEELTLERSEKLTEIGYLIRGLSDEQVEELIDLAIEMNGLA